MSRSAPDSDNQTLTVNFGAGVAVAKGIVLISYFVILGAALAGLAGVQPWAIGAAAIALASLSYAEHSHLYERGQELGLTRVLNIVMLKSMTNAVMASGAAYGLGWILRAF